MSAHVIYVPQDAVGVQTVSEALRIADWATPYLKRNGVALVVWKVRLTDLSNPRVLAAFKSRGIGNLPALISGANVLVGCNAIESYYRGMFSGATAAPSEHIFGGIAPRNRGRPFMGPRPSTLPRDVNVNEAPAAPVEISESGEDILESFYDDEARRFSGSPIDADSFGGELA
jgi:hypothetical protein